MHVATRGVARHARGRISTKDYKKRIQPKVGFTLGHLSRDNILIRCAFSAHGSNLCWIFDLKISPDSLDYE